MVRPANGRFAATLALALMVGGAAAVMSAALAIPPAHAAEISAEEAIRNDLARLVPPLWRLDSVTVDVAPPPPTSSKDGKTADQRATAKLTLGLTLGKPTYLIDSREGPVTFLRPVAAEGLEKTLNAKAVATRSATGWTVRFTPQNPEVLDGLGKPADEWPGQPVVLGTDEAKTLREQIDRDAQQRTADEAARRNRDEEWLVQHDAAAKIAAERAEKERQTAEARAAQITELRAKLLGADRAVKIAAYEAALGGNDPALRQMANEAALQSRDPLLGNLALKDWIARRRAIPVQLFATKEDANSEAVLQNLGPFTVEIDSFTPVNGAIAGRMGAPGYSIAKMSTIIGSLAQTELTLSSYGCALSLRLSEHQTLDGLLRCQTLPTLIARITLD
jgi:hypothetical protein